jgi:hypothetical protein
VGLQELLVYFDPWIAGVVLPNMIILGLMAIPYIDTNPRGIGYYSLKERPLANSLFLFGNALWFILIFIGYYCRGPNWAWYWPWENWLEHKPLPPPTWDFPVWAGLLSLGAYFGMGVAAPRLFRQEISWKKAIVGFIVVFSLIAIALKFTLGLELGRLAILGSLLLISFVLGFLLPQKHLRELDWPRYVITMSFVLMMMGVLLKIGLRLGFDVKYILSLPQFNFNI